MSSHFKGSVALQVLLDKIGEKGITADRAKLMKDFCAQFSDPREWVREFVVNSYDAGAETVRISAEKEQGAITVVVEDNGQGMDAQRVMDFFTLFRSPEGARGARRVGRHGIGKLSVAAVPGQCRFHMLSSTGREAWQLETGSLLAADPIRAMPVEPPPPRGTRFEVTFEASHPVLDELNGLRTVLERYIRYLPLRVLMRIEDELGGHWLQVGGDDWRASLSPWARHVRFTLEDRPYEAVIDFGRAEHGLYQNRVFVTDRYNLLAHGLSKSFTVPHLRVRVDSPSFELPFGRHALTNDEVLGPLARHLRERVLVPLLWEMVQRGPAHAQVSKALLPDLDEIAASLLRHAPTCFDFLESWPLFHEVEGMCRHSLVEVTRIVREHKALYLDDGQTAGVDYTAFGAPVFSRYQPGEGLALLTERFRDQLVNLSADNTVMEAPVSATTRLGPRELRFQRQLRFDPDTVRRSGVLQKSDGQGERPRGGERGHMAYAARDAAEGVHDFADLTWWVNYLVQRDGRTPCRTHLFFIKSEAECVLNLHHPEVQELLALSDLSPGLAGHWALALCLEDSSQRLLPHISADARDELLALDLLARLSGGGGNDAEPEAEDEPVPGWDDFLRALSDPTFGRG